MLRIIEDALEAHQYQKRDENFKAKIRAKAMSLAAETINNINNFNASNAVPAEIY